jgi:hypothetical protein
MVRDTHVKWPMPTTKPLRRKRMEDLALLLRELLDKLSDISSTLEDISHKLDNISGVYGIDDVISKLGELSDEIVGDTRYTLTDIYKEVSQINDKS